MSSSLADKIIENNKELIRNCINLRRFENNKRYFEKEIFSSAEYDELKTNNKSIALKNIALLEKLSLEVKLSNKPIYVFYHCFLENRWEVIFERQIEKMINSGLYDACTKLFLSIKGTDAQIERLKDIISGCDKFEIIHSSQNNTHEYIPLIKMKKFCDNNDCYCLYLHFKGVYMDNQFVWDWAEYMEYFCIEKWKLCVLALDLGHDTAGVDLTMHEKRGVKMLNDGDEKNINFYFAGNFYFCSSNYIKKLRELTPSKLKQFRWVCETWIGEGKHNAFCLLMSLKWLYAEKFKKEDYIHPVSDV